MKSDISVEIEVPKGVDAVFDGSILKIKGSKGEVVKSFADSRISMSADGDKIVIKSDKATMKEKKRVNTYRAIIKNALRGVIDGHEYVLKVCSGHFPMNVSYSKSELTVKNYYGGNKPKRLTIKEGVNVKVEGDKISLTGTDKNLVGQAAADMEKLCTPGDKDRRIFQDGLYIISKDGKRI